MDFDTLWTIAERARTRQRLPSEDIAFVREVVPTELDSFPHVQLPKAIRHPAGFSISGAPVGTFLRSALSNCRTEGAGQQVRRFGLLRNCRKGPGLWDHAFPLPPWLSQRDALLCPMHACRIPGAGGGRDPIFRLWPTRSRCETAHHGGRVGVYQAAQRQDAALGASERAAMISTSANQRRLTLIVRPQEWSPMAR